MTANCPRCASDDLIATHAFGVCSDCGTAHTTGLTVDLPVVLTVALATVLVGMLVRRFRRVSLRSNVASVGA